MNPAGWSFEQMSDYIKANKIVCPECGACDFTDIRKFNLMFKTFQGVTEDAKNELYLRPETAQAFSSTSRIFSALPVENPLRRVPDRQILPQ